MDWDKIKEEYYFEDETLRDIIVKGVSFKAWIFFIKMLNKEYKSKIFCNDKIIKQKLSMDLAKKAFNGKDTYYASIDVDGIDIHLYFLSNIVTCDLIPKEVTTLEKHSSILKFMEKTSVALRRNIIMTKENDIENPLIEIEYVKPEKN